VFEAYRFWTDVGPVEDTLFLLRALRRGIRLAALPDVHVIRQQSPADTVERPALDAARDEYRGWKRMLSQVRWPRSAEQSLRERAARAGFWKYAEDGLLAVGDLDAACRVMRECLKLHWRDAKMWRAWLAAELRMRAQRGGQTTRIDDHRAGSEHSAESAEPVARVADTAA
jgi:hypothetical protein